MPVELIYDSENYGGLKTDYFSGYSQVLVVLVNFPVLIGSSLKLTSILELQINEAWEVFSIAERTFPIMSPSQNLLIESLPITSAPDSRINLEVELSEPTASIAKIYIF